ncbi:hypothetical protein CHS0354_038519 [Potamilus streckersoni]|uniref:alpha-L-fucosidase n=1 Tax=Potamilus streckersoni TaxID=2493646 RepID=A0AAE0VQ04_9BIVA|nr:hypothetical protein CHS0354_038519 [Potamilus streckersoni]
MLILLQSLQLNFTIQINGLTYLMHQEQGMLANSIRKRTNIKLGLYHSLFEWFNPLFLQDQANKFATNYFVTSKTMPELYELVNTYKPDIIWSDGGDGALDTYWNSKEFLAWLYNDSPVKDTVVTNDRWGTNCGCKHGGYLTCKDRYNPGKLQQRKWENAMTLDRSSWGYRREATLNDFLTIEELITLIVETVSCGGNILINVGPTKDGRITPIYEERLRQMGQWLKVNGEAIYKTKPWTSQNDTVAPNVWYTSKKSETGTRVYAFVLKWPETDILYLGSPSPSSLTRVTLLGYPSPIPWRIPASQPSGIELLIPVISVNAIPCQWAWVFTMENLAN